MSIRSYGSLLHN